MKKLFLSLFTFAILLAFTACEKGPSDPFEKELAKWENVEPNCYIFSAMRQKDKFGSKYTIQLMSNELSYENKVWKGDGDFVTLSLYANPLSDEFPVNKKYEFVNYKEVSAEKNQCLVGGYLENNNPMGTFAYDVDEQTQTAAGLLCTNGYVLCSGTASNAKIIAVLNFLTPSQEIVTREYVFSGKMNITFRQ